MKLAPQKNRTTSGTMDAHSDLAMSARRRSFPRRPSSRPLDFSTERRVTKTMWFSRVQDSHSPCAQMTRNNSSTPPLQQPSRSPSRRAAIWCIRSSVSSKSVSLSVLTARAGGSPRAPQWGRSCSAAGARCAWFRGGLPECGIGPLPPAPSSLPPSPPHREWASHPQVTKRIRICADESWTRR